MATILVVDDELGIRALLSEILSDEGHTIELAKNAQEARASRERSRPDLVLLDIWMPDVDGVTLLKEWGSTGQLTMPVIMMSGHGTIDTAVEATKFGAMAFLEKPITLQKLLRAVEQALVKTTPRPAPAAPPVLGVPASYPRPEALPPAAPGVLPMASAGLAPVTPLPHQQGLASEQVFELDRPLREARDAFEKSYFEFHLAKENGSMTRVAEKTGLERTHLYRKLKQLGVDLSRNKRGTGI
ncbi:response regulator [Roseateles chitosanitabidus]|jgi:DNA-binding NtrC family response regulator|uniref:response regulator n=1 Tax=Roseateles chitosanitabidus TaxID=65048 RepID=UPI00082D2A52|nr:response regulator [Roseateles chitosanitabidus]MBO9686715.1 response regulator [Roseateles chitosanitabidus]